MSWTVREFDIEKDSVPGAALVTACSSSPLSDDVFRSRIEAWSSQQPVKRLSVDRDGEFAAYMRVGQLAPNPKNSYAVSLFVDRKHRRQGIGSELHDRAVEFAQEHSASAMVTMTMEADLDGVSFSKNRGFKIVSRLFDSYLDLTSFDVNLHLRASERAKKNGYRITTLADIDLCEQTKRALFKAFNEADKDTPGIEYCGLCDWDTFNASVFGSKDFDPESVSVAMKGDEFVGYSNVSKSTAASKDQMFTGFTGVVPQHRRNGLAYAMKVCGIQYCLNEGAKSLKTENDTRNGSMLAVNSKLGFKEEQGEVMLVKDLEASK